MTDRNYPCGDDSSENLYQPIKKKKQQQQKKNQPTKPKRVVLPKGMDFFQT